IACPLRRSGASRMMARDTVRKSGKTLNASLNIISKGYPFAALMSSQGFRRCIQADGDMREHHASLGQARFLTHPFDDDKLREECGVFGIYGHADAAAHTVLGLHALQHRGQEAAGIVTYDGARFHTHRAMGQVADNFNSQKVIESLPGTAAVGHVRYSTTGETVLRNVQPLFAELELGGFAVAHNGNLTNAWTLRKQLIRAGAIFQSTSDTEVIIHLVAMSEYGTLIDRLVDALRQVEG